MHRRGLRRVGGGRAVRRGRHRQGRRPAEIEYPMHPWIETYRGAVSPWETDVTEHFTVAFYFDRVAMAEASLAAELGLGEALRAGGFVRRYDCLLYTSDAADDLLCVDL